ncbi:1,4-dihydroxy-6-naphthoate synthase [Halosquirtibacter xylanolyticus]|uniref:1,4-dihydroxy-6-naphthoate synthase n=1 Tax=Halosquirtibacter xylanolyticus TaxID=3374599 RepID=UPI0037485152|nr:1,4-dihydroxy-6-naphthoate synthase [Prolixibacteraceae bacterium]
MRLTLGFSTCPNDTFIFDAMVHQKIDTEGLSFDVHMADVEELNDLAFQGQLDITKLSYHAFCYLTDSYRLMKAGSALGRGNGPLLISHKSSVDLKTGRVAIPGKYTTANLLLTIAYPEIQNKEEMLFSDIENALLQDEIEAGTIIHENRFTYHERGLHKIADLGALWEERSGHPIPLGGIVTRRSFDLDLQQKIDRVMARSVQYAFDHSEDTMPFIKAHAQEMDPSVMRKHIELYVNDFTKDLGREGSDAIQYLFSEAQRVGLIKTYPTDFIIP